VLFERKDVSKLGEGEGLSKRTVSRIMLTLLLMGMLTLAFNIQPVKASGTIYIRADGSVEPDTAPISSVDNVTYTFTDNVYGSVVVERSNIIIDGNRCTLQGPGPEYIVTGFCLYSVSNVTIKDTHITGFYLGVLFNLTSYNVLFGNKIVNNMRGIRLSESLNNVISENNIGANKWYNIWLLDSSNNSFFANNITASWKYGLYLDHSANNSISGNNITNNWYNVELWHSSNNSISENDLINNGHGIGLYWDSTNNNISKNNVTNNLVGIHLYHSSNSSFFRNNIANNKYGTDLLHSSNNNIYHNNIVGNTYQVRTYNSENVWDDGHPSGGNYWSDHVCTGNPSDGSQPYIIDENNTDRYPFQDQNGWLLHRLTVNSSPIARIIFTINERPQATPYTGWLPEGSYTLGMPQTHNGYVWSHWLEDGDTSRIKTITLPGTTYTAVYTEPPIGGYSLPIKGHTAEKPLTLYFALIAILAASFTTIRRKIHKRMK
jgi:parallel beta-helix repeat protein